MRCTQPLDAHGITNRLLPPRNDALQILEQIQFGIDIVDRPHELQYRFGKPRMRLCTIENPRLRHPYRHPIVRYRLRHHAEHGFMQKRTRQIATIPLGRTHASKDEIDVIFIGRWRLNIERQDRRVCNLQVGVVFVEYVHGSRHRRPMVEARARNRVCNPDERKSARTPRRRFRIFEPIECRRHIAPIEQNRRCELDLRLRSLFVVARVDLRQSLLDFRLRFESQKPRIANRLQRRPNFFALRVGTMNPHQRNIRRQRIVTR